MKVFLSSDFSADRLRFTAQIGADGVSGAPVPSESDDGFFSAETLKHHRELVETYGLKWAEDFCPVAVVANKGQLDLHPVGRVFAAESFSDPAFLIGDLEGTGDVARELQRLENRRLAFVVRPDYRVQRGESIESQGSDVLVILDCQRG